MNVQQLFSFHRLCNAKSTTENIYRGWVWLILAVFVCSSTNLCMRTSVDNL